MKTLMVAALAVAAVGANVAFAEEDDGIVSAAPAIADPVNPQPGMLANAYKIDYRGSGERYKAMTALTALEKAPSIKSYADTTTSFTRGGVPAKAEINVIKWEGFIKCKRATNYTFSFDSRDSYSFYVNGRQYIDTCDRQESRDVELKLGWNKVVIVAFIDDVSDKLQVQYRPKGSLSDPRQLSPGMLFYDKPVEEEW